jgi:hypothetical protein
VAPRRGQFARDLGVEDPRLRVVGRVAIDGQGAIPRHLLHEVHGEVEALEVGGEIETEGRLSDPVRADERDFQWSLTAVKRARIGSRRA